MADEPVLILDDFKGESQAIPISKVSNADLDWFVELGIEVAITERDRRTGSKRQNPHHDPKSGKFAHGPGGPRGALSTGTMELSEKARAAVAANLKKHGLTQAAIESELEKSLTPSNVAAGKRWYPNANKYAAGLAAKHGVSMEQAVGVISAVSPRTPWPRNRALAERVLSQYKQHDGLSAEDAAARIGGGFKANLAVGVRIARGESIEATLTGTKRRCFFNNILAPGRTEDVTVDTWMQRAVMRTSSTGMDLDAAQDFIGANRAATNGAGAGYLAITQAARALADKHDLAPDEVQSAYWISVSGSTEGNRPGG